MFALIDAVLPLVQLNVAVKMPGSSETQIDFDLADEVVPAESKFDILATKIEVKMKKARPARWQSLEDSGTGSVSAWQSKVDSSAPTAKVYPSSKGPKNWDALSKNEEEEKLEGDAALNKVSGSGTPSRPQARTDWHLLDICVLCCVVFLAQQVFKDIYSNASDDQRRAMMKSFYESGGTVLSTNWEDVGKAPVKGSPPEGLEMRRWSDMHK